MSVSSDDKLGGAIIADQTKILDIEPTNLMHIDQVLRAAVNLNPPVQQFAPFVHGLVDFIPRNIQGGDQFYYKYVARSESELHKNLVAQTTGRGLKHDHPEVASAIFNSLQAYPELANLYHRA